MPPGRNQRRRSRDPEMEDTVLHGETLNKEAATPERKLILFEARFRC